LPSDSTGLNATWVAQRVPEGHFSVVPNVFVIREVDLSDDGTNFKWASNMLDVAKSWGSWTEGTPFDFSLIFSGGE